MKDRKFLPKNGTVIESDKPIKVFAKKGADNNDIYYVPIYFYGKTKSWHISEEDRGIYALLSRESHNNCLNTPFSSIKVLKWSISKKSVVCEPIFKE